MPKVNELIEWEFGANKYSVYIKHFIDDEGRKGMTMIYEDVSTGKVTEMMIPPHKYPSFLRVVNDGSPRHGDFPRI